MNIRLVRPEDSEAVRAIYAQYIHTPITFECTLPSQQAFAQRIAEICGEYPYLVCAEGTWSWDMPMRTVKGKGKPISGMPSCRFIWMKDIPPGDGEKAFIPR